jgi:hypothetical protein
LLLGGFAVTAQLLMLFQDPLKHQRYCWSYPHWHFFINNSDAAPGDAFALIDASPTAAVPGAAAASLHTAGV